MSPVNESVRGNLSTSAPTLELNEIQATVLRQRPAPYFGTHLLFVSTMPSRAAGSFVG